MYRSALKQSQKRIPPEWTPPTTGQTVSIRLLPHFPTNLPPASQNSLLLRRPTDMRETLQQRTTAPRDRHFTTDSNQPLLPRPAYLDHGTASVVKHLTDFTLCVCPHLTSSCLIFTYAESNNAFPETGTSSCMSHFTDTRLRSASFVAEMLTDFSDDFSRPDQYQWYFKTSSLDSSLVRFTESHMIEA